MKITLKDGWPSQIIAATGQSCAAGEVIEVDADLGRSLCEQTDKWTRAKTVGGQPKPDEGAKEGDV